MKKWPGGRSSLSTTEYRLIIFRKPFCSPFYRKSLTDFSTQQYCHDKRGFLKIVKLFSKELRKLTANLLSPKPNLRPTAQEVVNETRKENRQGLQGGAIGTSAISNFSSS